MSTSTSHRRSRRSPRRGPTLLLACALGLTLGTVTGPPAAAAEPAGTLVPGTAPSAALGGAISFTTYLPPGYAAATESYPTLYLLHGRGDTQSAWTQVAGELDAMIADGSVPPMVVVMPDAPWSGGGSWYVDSTYTGTDPAADGPGQAVETALTRDLVTYVDATYRTVDDRSARAVGGYSMGGAGALRYTLAHQDVFSAAIVLSPAVYVPTPPADSSTRDYGAYGVGTALFDQARYDALNYPAGLAALDPALPVHLFIAVGDDEYANPAPADASHDLDLESAQLYNTARRVPGVTAELRVLNGGHDWTVWRPAFREGLVDVAAYLRTTVPDPLVGATLGSAGDDRAGGVVASPDGSVIVAVNAASALPGVGAVGGMDAVVQARSATGDTLWSHVLGTVANDRAYGLVPGAGGAVLAAGYTRGDLDGAHPSGASDDLFVAAMDSTGTRQWLRQLGDPLKADRAYATASDGAGGIYVAGYTSGSFDGTASAGDKDAVLARFDGAGTLLWSDQIGSPGEDKALAISLAADGGAYVAGVAGGALPGATGLGANDGWVARYTAAGGRQWVTAVGTAASDQVLGLATTADAVVAVGDTEGTLGAHPLGDKDAFVVSLGTDGTVRWSTQVGTTGDDRAVAVVAEPTGRLLVLGHTSGRLAGGVGGVDLFRVAITPTGGAGPVTQFGTIERDGMDDYDSNLYVAYDGAATAWVGALTYGAADGATNAGAGDILLTSVAFGAPAAPGAGPGAGVTPPVSGGGGSAAPSTASAVPVVARVRSGLLSSTGFDALRMLLLAGALVTLGGGAVGMRRRTGGSGAPTLLS
ncbi:alpha/beta hydrolase-fold protein [Pengzhenrongella frigida]|uniref:Esterase n=1 Tax=Pengzhenrongella frigida TaxID=1259133 RepID=A0A4Q5N1Z9_9MICO|nr:alpha/beta hydrolase-fold protein [Cellulomonas sp. HLT2-17]RYV52125.1 esterase [Cellulomonas sp. HLT2-17]